MQKHQNNGQKLLQGNQGQVWPCSVSTYTSNHFATSRPIFSFSRLGSRIMKFVGRESFFNKKIELKRCFLFSRVHSKTEGVIKPNNFLLLKKLHTGPLYKVSGKKMCCWEESWQCLTLIFCHAAEFSCLYFSLRERIWKQLLFATYCKDVGVWIRPLECSRKLSVRFYAAHMRKWPFKP